MDLFGNGGRGALDTSYAGKKRRRPAKRATVPADANAKSNPSKRHRERLNAELERLSQLLPFDEDTISRLDKLSILRLCVSYLRNKSFFQVALDNEAPVQRGNELMDPGGMCSTSLMHSMKHHRIEPDGPTSSSSGIRLDGESEMLLQALNGFLIVVEADGEIFYASPSVVDFLGFHNVDVMHQNVFELIHKEDRADFQNELVLKGLPPGDSDSTKVTDVEGSLDRNFLCRFRCLLDESSGFLNLHFTGKLRPMFGQRTRGEDGKPTDVDPPKMGLFALACPAQQPSIMEIYVRNMIFRTKHELNFKPLSLDSKASDILGYSELEMNSISGYNYLHYEDIIYCSEMHSQLMRKGETQFIYFRLMTKTTKWLWVQAKGRVIYKNGKPDSLVSTHRPMSDEEGARYLANRGAPFKFPFEGPAELYGCNPPMPKEIYKAITMGGGPPPGMGGPPPGMGGPPPGMGGPPPGMGGPPPGMDGPGLGGPPFDGPPNMGGPPRPGLPPTGRNLLPGRPLGTIPSVAIPPPRMETAPETKEATPTIKMESVSPTSVIKEEQGSPRGLAGQRMLQRMPIPEDSMAKRLLDQDLAEALKNIHFDNSLENISNSAWLKEFEHRPGQSQSSVSESESSQQPTFKYSPGNSPHCLYQQRSPNAHPTQDPHPGWTNLPGILQGDVSQNNNENDCLSELPSRDKTPSSLIGNSPHSNCHTDSGVESDEARSGIHHIEEDLALLEAQLNRQGAAPNGRGPLESTDSIESGFDLSELDVTEFEGTEINLDEVLNLMEGVETSDPQVNFGGGYLPSPLGQQQPPPPQKRADCLYGQENPGLPKGGSKQHPSLNQQNQQRARLLQQQNAGGQKTLLYNSKRTVAGQGINTSSCIRGTQTSPAMSAAEYDMVRTNPVVVWSVDLSTQTNSGLSADFEMTPTKTTPINLNMNQIHSVMSADFGMTHGGSTVASELNRTPMNNAMLAQTNPEFTNHSHQSMAAHQFPGQTSMSTGQRSHFPSSQMAPQQSPSNPHPSQGMHPNHQHQPPQYSEHVALATQEPVLRQLSHFQRAHITTPSIVVQEGLSSNGGVMVEQGPYFYRNTMAPAPQNGIQSVLPDVEGRYITGCNQNGFSHPGGIRDESPFTEVPLPWGDPNNSRNLGLEQTQQHQLVMHN